MRSTTSRKIKHRTLRRSKSSAAIQFLARNALHVVGLAILFVMCHQIGLIRRVIRDETNGFQNSTGLLRSFMNTSGSLNVISINDKNNGFQDGGVRSSSKSHIRKGGKAGSHPLLTVLILTYSEPKALKFLLRSLTDQKLARARFEVIVVDNGCQPDTKRVYDHSSSSNDTIMSKFLPLCDNPGYAVGNNKGAMMASPDSKYILFLNDDIQLSSPNFIENMILLAESKPNAAAVGCKVVNGAGNELIEAGSIIFKDGSAMGYGRGMKDDDIFRSEYSYPRPVDYVSGACLLIEKKVFMGYKHGPDGFGFDHERFANYYEDTDLQMHIQHDLKKEVWLQPKSIAKREEHGLLGEEDSEKLMQKAQIVFHLKWESALEKYHVPHPIAATYLEGMEFDRHLLLAADVRAKKTSVANILYIDDQAPYLTKGSGFGRSFDNLSMIAELGHRITLCTNYPEGDEEVIDGITDLGVEYYKGDLGSLVSTRASFYDVVIISRPDTFRMLRESLRSMYLKHPFTLVYDAEALSFRRDELRTTVMSVDKIQFPEENALGGDEFFLRELKKSYEISLIKIGDIVITVSDQESKAIAEILPNGKNVHTIGHIMDRNIRGRKGFQNRQGILFLGAFHDQMYYNGDAIWYFLTEVYPLIIKKTKVPISLKIVGRGIPQQLRDTVEMNEIISQHVTFYESPNSIGRFVDGSRVLIAPHLYGAGIQYKVSEALSNGLPVVMSRFTYDSFGKVPGCVGSDPDSMKQCIIDVHGDKGTWTTLQKQGFDFIDKTHDRKKASKEWSKVIDGSLALAKKRNEVFVAAENAYDQAYPTLLERRTSHGSGYQSFLEHYVLYGKKEGKIYSDANEIWNGLADDFEIKEPTEQCEEGEHIYLNMYPDVAMNWTGSAFSHYTKHGKKDGRTYVCISMLSNYIEIKDPMEKCPEGESPESKSIYLKMYPDVAKSVANGDVRSAFHHWRKWGKNEGRQYFCFTQGLGQTRKRE